MIKNIRKSTMQNTIMNLQDYWANLGCLLLQPLDMHVGAGTFHPATFLRSLSKKPWKAAYVQASRRPADGRYGNNPNRTSHYYQFQVIMKPHLDNIQDLYIKSLENLGINPLVHDIRFVEDNWESPSLGASGIGWEVWCDGMEITQFTYFQQVGGIECKPIVSEITYGLERICMFLQKIDNIFDIVWSEDVKYRDLFLEHEKETCRYNFDYSDTADLLTDFERYQILVKDLLEKNLPVPAYEFLLKASHAFNILEARNVISVNERQRFILKIRSLSCLIAKKYLEMEDSSE